jgi:hypothetical protein
MKKFLSIMLHTTRRILKRYKKLTLLLYEAMSYTTDPLEAHLQLGLLLCCHPSATMEMLKMFSNLFQWLTDGEITCT